MDDAIITVYEKLAHGCRATADKILEDPDLRTPFLADVRQTMGHLPEREILHRLTHLRKAGKLTRSRDLITNHKNNV